MIQQKIVTACRTLGLIGLNDMRAFVRNAERKQSVNDALTPMFNPEALHDGTYEDAKHQLNIARCALALLEAIHAREAHASKHRS